MELYTDIWKVSDDDFIDAWMNIQNCEQRTLEFQFDRTSVLFTLLHLEVGLQA